MSKQQSYTNQLKGFSGQLVGTNHDADSFVNDSGAALQQDDLTVDTAADSTVYTFEVDGVSVSINSGTGATLTSIRDALIVAYRNTQELETVAAINPSGADTARLTALVKGTGYTLTESDANLSTAAVVANGTTQTPKFGRAMVRRAGGGDQSAALPSAASQEFLGVNSRIHSDVDPTGAPKDATAPFKTMSLVRGGKILVEVEEAVSAGDPAFFRHTAGAGGTELGIWRNDADTATADQVTGAKFTTSTTGAGLAELSLKGA